MRRWFLPFILLASAACGSEVEPASPPGSPSAPPGAGGAPSSPDPGSPPATQKPGEARITLHNLVHRGKNFHHINEATFKAFGMALRQATRPAGDLQSTKGKVHWKK